MFIRIRLLILAGLISVCHGTIHLCDGIRSLAILMRITFIDALAWLYLLRFEAKQQCEKDPHGVLGDEMLGLAAIAIFIGWLAISLYGPAGDNTVTVAWMLK